MSTPLAGRAFTRASLPDPLVSLLTLTFLAVLIRTAWISDDALITLRTVLNVTHGFGLRFNIAERVQTFTHPLWMLLLTAGYTIVGNVYVTTFAASILCSLVVFWAAVTRAISPMQAVAAGVVLIFSEAFIDFSTSGLENPLMDVLLLAFTGVFLSETLTRTRRLTWLCTLTSLIYLTRPDAVLLVVPPLALAAGILVYLVYVVSIGGDFMTGRFIAVPVFAAVLLITRFLTAPKAVWGTIVGVLAIVATTAAHFTLWSNSRYGDAAPKPSGIVDERA